MCAAQASFRSEHAVLFRTFRKKREVMNNIAITKSEVAEVYYLAALDYAGARN
jgi:hypothetical protein